MHRTGQDSRASLVRVAGSIVLVLMIPVALATASDIVFTKEARTISGTVTAESTSGVATDSDSSSASGFGQFNASISISATAPRTEATVLGYAFQISTLTPSLISLLGSGSFFSGSCSRDCIELEAQLASEFSVTFVAPSTFHFALTGTLGLTQPPPCDEGGLATFKLIGPNGAVFNVSTTIIAGLNGAGVLPPGEYTITSSASPAPSHFCLDSGETIHLFKFFVTQCSGDLDSSAATDGADLAILLGAWGSTEPVSDINDDGIVNAFDLGILLGNWGSCESDNVCLNSGHDCFTPGLPGCNDVYCCDSVCRIDPFCCDVAWDHICIDEAGFICGVP